MDTPNESTAQRLAQLLGTLGTSAAFATRLTIDADPQLHVQGVGSVPLPIGIHTAHQLCAVAQPAHHGYKEETRLDPRVRDTWEIPADRIGFDAPDWQDVLAQALVRIGRDLGIPAAAGLRAELHNLLVYAPGQFFAVHQDSEKADGMLGTLVVTLPSAFTGGEFVVSHQGQRLSSRGSKSLLGLMAFYADCHHEVRPVKQGYRVVLTYNLIVPGGARVDALPAQSIAALGDAVQQFWQTPSPPRWTGDTVCVPPDRLVYLLDHQYTQSGLSWAHLKGADAARVAALRQVAEQLDAEIFLALADVHETWSAEGDDSPYGRRDWDDEYDEDDCDEDDGYAQHRQPSRGSGRAPVLGELIDSDIGLRHWLAPAGKGQTGFDALEAGHCGVARDELCWTRASDDCTPFHSEYEGYMGNYGNTVDRWYHRAAVVMWPRERAFVIRAKQSPLWAMAQIAAVQQAGDATRALEWAQRLLPFWKQPAGSADDALLTATLPVAVALDDAGTAAALLAPFAWVQLNAEMAPWMLRLLEQHGLSWCRERLQQWASPYRESNRQLAWLGQVLPELTRAWSQAACDEGKALAAVLAQERWQWLQQRISQIRMGLGGSVRVRALVEAGPALLGVLRASCDAARTDLQQNVVATVLAAELPLEVPLAVLRAAQANDHGDAGPHAELAEIYAHCVQTLSTRLAQPERAADDWSIQMPSDSLRVPELAERLSQFLSAPAQQRLEWPLAEAKRQAIQQFIERHELPVRCATRRSGRPYTLVLEKMPALFQREADARREWARELAQLRHDAARFASTA